MSDIDIKKFKAAILRSWSITPSPKAETYISTFFDTRLIGNKIVGRTEGNHGTYTVSIELKDNKFLATCSCYIGKSGYCHHCEAMAWAYIQNPARFIEVAVKQREDVEQVSDLQAYLQGVTLESLLLRMREQGITQKAFAESIGMNPRHLTAIKSSEARNHFFNELGATKLACLWVLEHIGKVE